VGTDQVNGLLPLLDEDSIVVTPATLDIEWVRQPRLLAWGTPYQFMAINGLAYYRDQPGNEGKTICSLVLATGYGQAAQEGLEFAARELGFDLPVKARFRQDDQDFVAPITQLRNARCEGILFASLPGVTGKILGAAAQLGYEPRWIAQGPSFHQSLIDTPMKDYYTRNLWIVADGPQWGDTTVAGMRALLAAVARYTSDQQPDLYYLGGYVAGRTAHALLEKAVELGDLSRAGILRALEQVTVRYDGLWSEYRYGPAARREPPRTASIFRVNPAKPGGAELIARDYTSATTAAYRIP
jgi:ABC-type branched-subunit amino acid transport system substrate-binding protein